MHSLADYLAERVYGIRYVRLYGYVVTSDTPRSHEHIEIVLLNKSGVLECTCERHTAGTMCKHVAAIALYQQGGPKQPPPTELALQGGVL